MARRNSVKLEWVPSESVLEALLNADLFQYDRVELVIAAYAASHGGNSPSQSEIASVLGVAKQNVAKRMTQLEAQDRAKRFDGKFMLIESEYRHPLVARFLGA